MYVQVIVNHLITNSTKPTRDYYQYQFHQYQPMQQPQTQYMYYVNYINTSLVGQISSYLLRTGYGTKHQNITHNSAHLSPNHFKH